MTMEEILLRYTKGEATLEETNQALREVDSGLCLDPARNTLSAEEAASATAGGVPAQANGWGLMDHGFGGLEKVRVENGRTVDADMGGELAFVFIGGKKYALMGSQLAEISRED